jgi:hypothetical protein
MLSQLAAIADPIANAEINAASKILFMIVLLATNDIQLRLNGEWSVGSFS